VVSRVLQQFKLDVSVRSLFDTPTIAKMARVIDQNRGKASSEALEPVLSEVEAMSEEQARRLLDPDHGQS